MRASGQLELDSYRLAQYAVACPCYICGGGNNFDAELCRHCYAPMALMHQANSQKIHPRMVAAIAVPSPAACPALRPVLVLRSRPRLSSARPSGQDHDACLQTQRCDDLVRCAEQVHRPSDCHDRRVWAARSTRCRSQPTPKTASSEVRCRVEAVRDEKKSAFEFPVFATLETGAQTDELRANGQLFTCQPARLLPMAQR